MNYHRQEPAFAERDFTVLSVTQPHSHGLQLLTSTAIFVLTCLALTFLDAWPSTTKRRLWETFVYLIPSRFVYVMEIRSRRRNRGAHGNESFKRKDFGNHQAKSDALQRIIGSDDDPVGTAVQRARRLSGLDRVLGISNLRPAGLGNWDNSCYQNSIIQSLASLPSFAKYLASNVARISSHEAKSTHNALRSIIGRLNHSDNQGRRLWTPSILKSMNSWQQQDAQEYFSRIIDEVDQEISKATKQQATDLGFGLAAENVKMSTMWQHNPCQGLLAQRVGCMRCGYSEGLSLLPFTCLTVNLGPQWEQDVQECLNDYTALESIEGVECIKCTVLRTKASLDQVLLNLNTNEASKPHMSLDSTPMSTLRKTVTERLRHITQVCEVDDFSDSGLYKTCNISAKSRVSSTKSKQAIVARAPTDLVIHVNRSIFDASGMQRKNHAHVRFPLNLDIGRWCLGSSMVQPDQEVLETWNTSPIDSMLPCLDAEPLSTSKLYKLRAVITHYGGHENGHYIAYRKRSSNWQDLESPTTNAKNPEESWYCFSDDVVSPISEDDVLSQGGVFMLFYEATCQSEKQFQGRAPEAADISTIRQRQPKVAASSTKTESTDVEDGSVEGIRSESDAAQPIHRVLPSTDVDPPRTSPLVTESPSPQAGSDVTLTPAVQPESTKPPSIAPLMRTAGALSPNPGTWRRSSNLSIHSPSFITAS